MSSHVQYKLKHLSQCHDSLQRTRKRDSYDALQHEAARRRASRFLFITRPIMHQPASSIIPQGLFRQSVNIYQYFLSKFVLRMRTNCYFRAFGQNSDTAVGFGEPDFLYRVG